MLHNYQVFCKSFSLELDVKFTQKFITCEGRITVKTGPPLTLSIVSVIACPELTSVLPSFVIAELPNTTRQEGILLDSLTTCFVWRGQLGMKEVLDD
jgi:hypothetical protein